MLSRILLISGSTKSATKVVAYPPMEGQSCLRMSLTNSARSKSGKATQDGNELRERPSTSGSVVRVDNLQ